MVRFALVLLMILSNYGHAFEVHGHRGCRGVMPENTLVAFEAAANAGVDVLELDLHVTSDGEVVIYHDYFINEALIKDLPLSAIKAVDCGSRFDREFPFRILAPAQIPTLQELFDLVRDKTVRLNLEIKHDPINSYFSRSPKELAEKIVALVQKNGYSNRVYYSSFSPELLSEVRQQDPNARIIFIIGRKSLSIAKQFDPQNPMQFILSIASSFQAEAIAPNDDFIDDATLLAVKRAGFRVIPWTVNDMDRARELIQLGVDGLISDYPQTIVSP